jgi:replicative DNA helicase
VTTCAGLVPPNDLDAEAAVLSACMLSGEALDEVADVLRPEHFYSEANADIWRAITGLRSESSPVDIVLVGQAMRAAETLQRCGGASRLAQIVDGTPATAHVSQHAELVVALSRLRRAIAVCHERAAVGYGAASDVAGYLAELEAEVMRLGQDDSHRDGVTLRESLCCVAEQMVAAEHRGTVGLETGLVDLDRMLGGLRGGDLVVLASRPGMGKSALAGAIARNAAEVCAVAWFSLEMPHEQLSARLISAECGVDLRKIQRPWTMTHDDRSEVNGAAQLLEQLPITIEDRAGLTATDIRSRARRMASAAKRGGLPLGLVLVDYLQLVRAEASKNASRDEQVSQMTRAMKCLARDLSVPVLLLSQLNRGVESRSDKRPMLSDLRESGAIEQDADDVLFLFRPGYYDEQRGAKDTSGETEIIIAKQRNGPTGIVKLRWFGGSCSFRNTAGGRDEPQSFEQWAADTTPIPPHRDWTETDHD